MHPNPSSSNEVLIRMGMSSHADVKVQSRPHRRESQNSRGFSGARPAESRCRLRRSVRMVAAAAGGLALWVNLHLGGSVF
jgi:hypothetical protein